MLADELTKIGGRLFEKAVDLHTLWQEIAENFYPERADFTVKRSANDEFADHLATSVPVTMRRDLGDAVGGMLRPTNKVWAHIRVSEWDQVGPTGRAWLERANERQRRAMYHKDTQFVRAAKEADHDFITFGNSILQITTNTAANGLLYRCWHLRDCVWSEGPDGPIDTVFRRWKTAAINVVRMFPKTVHADIRRKAQEEPFCEVELWHCEVPSDITGDDTPRKLGRQTKSVYLDVANKHIMEEVDLMELSYNIARWRTLSGSQYGYSPATMAALPDSRTMQEMMITLLEAGEKATTPPLIGVQEALRGDINVMAGGVTWVDREYDERLGEVLRPLTVDKNGIPLGMDMRQELKAEMADIFYLSKLFLPPLGGPDMTAYEVGQRVQEHIRQTLPLFEPMETECNAPIYEKTFNLLLRFNVFGQQTDIPEELQGKEVRFEFESPLHDAVERVKTQKYLEATSLLANAAGVDPNAIHIMDFNKGAKDALMGSGVPAAWLRTDAEVEQIIQQIAEKQQADMVLQQMQQGADIAKTVGMTPSPAGTGGTSGPTPI